MAGWVLDILWSVIVVLCLSKVVFQQKGYLMRAFKKFAYHTIFQGKVKEEGVGTSVDAILKAERDHTTKEALLL